MVDGVYTCVKFGKKKCKEGIVFMHWRVRREGEGSYRSPLSIISWYMHPTLIATNMNSFFKDSRNTIVHDCALSKSPQDSLPSIGLSRWLTERLEEVDQLICRTRIEMHGTMQPGGRSPKQANGLALASQLKPGLESVQSSGTSFPSPHKGKKRERGDHSTNPVKRERVSRIDDGDSTQCKAESSVKSDIAKITEKGGLVDFDGVKKLVQLMQPDRVEKKIDLINCSMLAGVVAATEKVECLNWFVQLRGLPVLDEWLQEIHKGKVGSGSNSKDGDKSVEEFVLVLLHALDKLPVNLHALQTCNIGRSVNHLRSHKNVEIQRKARSLVDTWKKRVEAEMNSIDAKSGSTQDASVWSSNSRLPDLAHDGSRSPSGSNGAMKSSNTQHSEAKTTLGKSSHGESNMKSATSSSGPVKPASPPVCNKEIQLGISVGGTPDVPLIREDRSSSSDQSHSYTQSSLGKDDGKSSGSLAAAVSKVPNNSSRNQKVSGFPGDTGGKKENNCSRSSSAHRSTTDKLCHSSLTNEKVIEGSATETSSHKLIVKIPNLVRSPTQGVSGVSLEDPSSMRSQASPPVLSDKLVQLDNNSKEKSDAHQCSATSNMNADACQINDRKDILTVSGDGAGSPSVISGEEKGMSIDDSRRSTEVPKKIPWKCGKSHEISFSALIESCVKYSEAHSSLSLEDDVGMNLLASVATGEMSRSELVSPTDSTERSMPAMADVCFVGNEAKPKSSPDNQISESENQFPNFDDKKQALLNGSWSEDVLCLPKQVSLPTDITCSPSLTSADISTGVSNNASDSACAEFKSSADCVQEVSERSNQKADTIEKIKDADSKKEILEETVSSSNSNLDNILNCSNDGTNSSVTKVKAGKDLSDTDKGKLMVEVASSNQSCNIDCKHDVNEEFDVGTNSVKKLNAAVLKSEFSESAHDEKLQQSAPRQRLMSEAVNEVKVRERDESDTKCHISEVGRENFDIISSPADGHESHNTDTKVENKESAEHISLSGRGSPTSMAHEWYKNDELKGLESIDIKADEAGPSSTVAEVSSTAALSDPDAKANFDLNEGFTVDEGKYEESVCLATSASTTVQMTNGLQFSVNSIPTLQPTSITVAAAAKGPFVPSEDLSRNKGELGWKGSTVTSAFRPAEPRKGTEMSLASLNFPFDASACKNERAMLNIDLNVPDERVLGEMGSHDSSLSVGPTTDMVNNHAMLLNESSGSMPVHVPGGLDFDLNRVDESNENGLCSTSHSRDGVGSMVHVRPVGGLPSTDVRRGFNLNDQPGVDDAGAVNLTISQQVKVGVPSQLPSAGIKANHPGVGSFSSWFSPGNTYTSGAIPSVMPDHAGQPFQVIPPGAPQRTFGPAAITPCTSDAYRGPVLSLSHAVSFPSSPFQFPVFPFGSSFPLPSATLPTGATSYADSSSGVRLFAPPVNSHMLGPVGEISSQFQRSYAVGLPGISSNIGLENSRKWDRQGLDLNAGPGATESEVREDVLPLSLSQHSVASSRVQADEQTTETRMYPVSSSILKRTEPDIGRDKDSFRYKQLSWQ